MTFEQNVRNVIIAPSAKLFLPNLKEELPGLNEIDEFFPGKKPEKNYRPERGRNKNEREEMSESTRDTSGEISIYPELSSGFRLDKPSESNRDLPSSNKLNFSLHQKEIESLPKNIEKKEVDFSKYLSSDYSKTSSSRTRRSSGSIRGGNVSPRGSALYSSKDFDITLWADGVVNKIQKNWLTPTALQISEKGKVKISVIIQKDGEILSVEVIDSSKIGLLDQAALKAISLSSPFPKLPDDFPYEQLEIFLVFENHD